MNTGQARRALLATSFAALLGFSQGSAAHSPPPCIGNIGPAVPGLLRAAAAPFPRIAAAAMPVTLPRVVR